MKATNFAMIVFSAAAIVLSGCSGDNRVTGPRNGDTPEIDKSLVESTTPAVTENNAARIAVNSFDQEIERIGFEATVKKSEVEGGCLYLETEKTERYTPYFEEGAPVPSVGQQLYVSGYVDENMNSYCMIGPVFHVEKYTILWRNDYGSEVGGAKEAEGDNDANSRNGYVLDTVIGIETSDPVPGSDASDGGSISAANSRNGYILDTVIGIESSDPVPGSDGSAASDGGSNDAASDDAASPQDDLTALTGRFFVNEEGCQYMTDGKDIITELEFNQASTPDLPNGKRISVRGEYSLLTWSPCLLAPLFNVEDFEVLDDNHYVAEDGRAGN